jgi:uncharacterized protein (DUF433 family)
VLREYPQLEAADVEGALEYYEAHRAEIDEYMRENLAD